MSALRSKRALEERLRKYIEEALASAHGNVVTLTTKRLCRGQNPKPCSLILEKLCKETPGCYKRRRGRYVFPKDKLVYA